MMQNKPVFTAFCHSVLGLSQIKGSDYMSVCVQCIMVLHSRGGRLGGWDQEWEKVRVIRKDAKTYVGEEETFSRG